MPVDHGRRRDEAPIETPSLVADRWRLRPVAVGDAGFLFETMTDPGMIRARSAAPPDDEAAMSDWIDRAIAASNAGTSVTWIVIDDDERNVGLVVLQEIDRTNAVAEAGYFVSEHARNSGAATACLSAITAWAFEHLDLERVQLFHDTDNSASCRVAFGAGFGVEGTLRSSRRRFDGSRADQELHARLRADSHPDQPVSTWS